MSAIPKLMTAEQYLAQERQALSKSEFFRGEVFAMTGGSANHSLIATNFVGEARQLLKGKRCKVFNSDLRIKVNPAGLYTYPDATIVCGEPEFDDARRDTLINPTVLVEVLSDSTEKYDRGTKSGFYRQIASLREIILISQDQPAVERYIRQPEGGWLLMESRALDETVEIGGVEAAEVIGIQMSEIYRGVAFESRATVEGLLASPSDEHATENHRGPAS